ncbi:hypothetical protein IV203_007500 [Nitzschia inconspicua]|uniref:Uncharacterized protein n=1 Tax=Nitzschia inconspicua TaxID=303405 RepID=A0A9K3KEV9_9STRA|nr:hypothetical protein IV203_007500 [Nitzschia inconspicua]
MEDGSVVEGDAISVFSSVISSRSVVRMTEAFMDELCMSIENDLLGSDENYKDAIRDYRKYKQSRSHSSSDYDTEEEETILSSSFGTYSDGDIESLRSEPSEGNRTRSMIQALFLTALPSRKNMKLGAEPLHKSSHGVSAVEVEPMYNTGPDASLDSVEVVSLKDDLDNKASKQVDSDPASDSSTEVATEDSSSHGDTTEDTRTLDTIVVNDFFTPNEQKESVPSELRNAQCSILDTSSHHSDRAVEEKSPIAETLSNHLRQRHAIYVWHVSVLQQKMQEQQEGDKVSKGGFWSFIHPTRKPRSIQEYDQTMVRALSLSASHNPVGSFEDSACDISEFWPFFSRRGQDMKSRKDHVRRKLQQNAKMVNVPLKLQKRIEESKRNHQSEGRGWHQRQEDLKKKVVSTAKKSFFLLHAGAKADVLYIAMKLKKRALKLHEMLSLLNLKILNRSNKEDTVVSVDVFEEDSIEHLEESVELVQTLSVEANCTKQQKPITESKIMNHFKHPQKWKVSDCLSLSTSPQQSFSSDGGSKRNALYYNDSPESARNEEETDGIEVIM